MEDTIDKKWLSEDRIEAAFLIVLFGAMLFFVIGTLYDNRISHDFPYSYYASDGFAYLFLSEHVQESGNQKYHPFYSAVGYNDVLWQHGLIIYSVSAIFSSTTGLEVYDSLYLISGLFIALNALAVYLIIRGYSRKLAIISAG